jgi:tRNA 2-thiouridine synthesizing protein A
MVPAHQFDGPAMNQELDATGLRCPLPVLRAKKRLKDVAPGALLVVRATDADAPTDFEAFCAETGHELVSSSVDGEVFTITIRRAGPPSA